VTTKEEEDGDDLSFSLSGLNLCCFSSLFFVGERVLGPRYGDDEARNLAIEATARGLDVAGFHTQTSGRYDPVYPTPPAGGLLSREQYLAGFHHAHHPLPSSLERDMLEIHQAPIPIGGDRWAYNQRLGFGHVGSERSMEISHLAW